MVDSNSYLPFKVPEWVVVLATKDVFDKQPQVLDSATLFVPKKPTREPDTDDENLPTIGTGTSTPRNVRKQKIITIADDNTPSKFIGRSLKLYLPSNTVLKRRNTPYGHRSFRVPVAANMTCLLYFCKKLFTDTKVVAFSVGRTKVPLSGNDVDIADLGSLMDAEGATTSGGAG
ncbi:MAG: hypothetical protein AAFO04_25410 [Cyanobacteria bacterium J06592_8]